MNLRGRIPIEPLDDERVVRIERAVVAGHADAAARGARAGSRWLLPSLAVTAAVAVIAAVAVWKLRPVPASTIASAGDTVHVEATPAGSHVDLGDAAIDVSPGAAFSVTRPDGGVLISLDRGLIDLAVAKRKGRAPLVVRAADVDVVVVGTRFSVELGATVAVTVREGVVRVRRGTDETSVAAGQHWSAPVQVIAGTPFPPATAITVAAGTDAGAGSTIGSGRLPTTDRGNAPELHDHTAVVPPDPGGSHVSGGAAQHEHGHHTGSGEEQTSGSGSSGGSSSPEGDLISQVRNDHVAAPADGMTEDEAVANYRKMIIGTGEEAFKGFYGLAYWAYQHRSYGDALRFIEGCRSHGSAAQLDDVLWMRIQILCKRPIDGSCRAAAHAYEAAFTGERAELANRLRNEGL